MPAHIRRLVLPYVIPKPRKDSTKEKERENYRLTFLMNSGENISAKY